MALRQQQRLHAKSTFSSNIVVSFREQSGEQKPTNADVLPIVASPLPPRSDSRKYVSVRWLGEQR